MKNDLQKFFITTIPLAWFWWIQIYLGLWPENLVLIPSTLGGISPIFTVWLIERKSDSENLNEILGSARRWKEAVGLLIVSAMIFPLLNVASKLASHILGSPLKIIATGLDELGLFLTIIIPLTFVSGLITSPLLEEPAWRGYAYPRLASLYGANVASLILGSYWWLWHQMMNVAFGMQPTLMHYLSMLGQSFIIDSLYTYSKGVILVAMFAHQSLFIMLNFLAEPIDLKNQIIYASILWLTAIFLRIRLKSREID
jgi:membrane protease YdiL (CAAX protease family)